jgi:actin-like ATPase involved in cell morphogenesis
MGLFSFLSKKITIAVDLGTSNTLIVRNNEIVINEPSVVAAANWYGGNLVAAGTNALTMQRERNSEIRVIHPIKDDIIADYRAAKFMFIEFLRMMNIQQKSLFSPHLEIVVCVPLGITELEERAVRDFYKQIGAQQVCFIRKTTAAAIGIGINVLGDTANLIVNISDDTCEINVISLGGILTSKSIRSAFNEELSLSQVESAILDVLNKTPRPLYNDIKTTGIHLVEGNSRLRGSDKHIQEKTKLPVHIVEDPLTIVVRGAAIALEDVDKYYYFFR